MLFAIHAYESTLCGLHGVEDFAIIECRNEEEAAETAREMSYDLIHSYHDIENTLYEEAAFVLGYNYDELFEMFAYDEELEAAFNEAYEEAENGMICYELYELDENCGATLEYLNSLEFDEVIDRFSKA